MKKYKNYIFDLYGTLIDIHTDENEPTLWNVLSDFYGRYGADYSPQELKDAYHMIVREELEEKCRKLCIKHADIKLEKVFLKLLNESQKKHHAELSIDTKEESKIWTASVANIFRALSMRRFQLFPRVHETLTVLRDRGAHIYLLSNAQRIFTIPEIEKAGLTEYFDAIYISSDFGAAKPEPMFMQALLREQQLDPSDCVFIGNDVKSDMSVASSCNVQGIFLNTDRHSEYELDQIMRNNDFIIIRSGNIDELL